MAAKKHKKDKIYLKTETVHGILAVSAIAIALFLVLSLPFIDKAGIAGKMVYKSLHSLFGIGFGMLPVTLLLLAFAFIKNLHKKISYLQVGSSIALLVSVLGMISITSNRGGLVGMVIATPLLKLFGSVASLVFLTAISVISLLIIFNMGIAFEWIEKGLKMLITRKKKNESEEQTDEESDDEDTEDVEEYANDDEYVEEPIVPAKAKEVQAKISKGEDEESFMERKSIAQISNKKYVEIPLSLLEKDKGTPGVGDVKANLNTIKRTLQNFGIDVEMDEVTIGPTVTRYALKPAEGIKLSRIVGLQNDLSLALAAHPIRIEAPIPGKSLVGIEIPNSTKSTVGLGSMIGSEEFSGSEKPLYVSLGKSIAGKSVFGNLGKMPHLLIAGATGSGKSVTIHAIITSLLYRNSPDNLKFIMIDPKRVELTLYNGIPHLYAPVITDAKKAILALKWAAKEMDRRYDILETEKVRDIESYHKNVIEPALKKMEKKETEENGKVPVPMPYIVVIIDELADIMATYPRELEASVVRLAQMSRAVGIHLILSTQRPSVNVITGLIKANIPARIALQVASQIDSRTILDTGGAEKLLGAGDMLYLSAEMSKPQRLQSAFISESEVKKVTKFIKDAYADELSEEIDLTVQENGVGSILESLEKNGLGDDEDDDLYEAAREEVIRAGKASTSYLQRKLSVGYARAARLIDMLEEKGVIGPGHGAKPREVLGSGISSDEKTDNEELA
jgi:S-DNA-T family DNA segregation ATPase FtsK/SpoIIIE